MCRRVLRLLLLASKGEYGSVRKDAPELLFPGAPPLAGGTPTEASPDIEEPAFAILAEPTDVLFGEETEADCADTQTAHAKIAMTHGVDRPNRRIAYRRRHPSESWRHSRHRTP